MQANIESLQPLFVSAEFDKAAAKIFGERVYRVEVAGLRHYLRADTGRTYKSLTTFLSGVMPRNKFLESWREQMTVDLGGTEKMKEWMDTVADYGTALHIGIAEYCRNMGVNWLDFEMWATDYLAGMNLKNGALGSAITELTKDFASLVQFMYDYRVHVIAVEVPVFLEAGVATLIDLVVEMDAKNYDKTPVEKRERVKAIINLKSGKKGFFEEHLLQLVGERRMFNHTFGGSVGYEIQEVYNLAPSDWKEKPTYKIQRQTEAIEKQELENQFSVFLELAKYRGILSEPSRKFPIFTGRTGYGENPVDALTILTYNEFSAQRIGQVEESILSQQ